MSSSQYVNLGNNCNSHSIAITSNNKFISIENPAYYKTFTPMLYYPGQSKYYHHDSLVKLYPEELKAFNRDVRTSKNTHKHKICKSCHGM
jgi:hypothetical protein